MTIDIPQQPMDAMAGEKPVPQLPQALIPLQHHLDAVKSCNERLLGLANRLQGTTPEVETEAKGVSRDYSVSIVGELERLDYEYGAAVTNLTDLVTRLEGIA